MLIQAASSIPHNDSRQLMEASLIQSSLLSEGNIPLTQESSMVSQGTSLPSQRVHLLHKKAVPSSKGDTLLQSVSYQPQHVTDQSLGPFPQPISPFQESSYQFMSSRHHVQVHIKI